MGEVVLLCRHSLKRPDRSIVGIVVLPKLKKHDPEMSSNLCPTAYFCILTLMWKKNIYNVLWGEPPLELPILRCFAETTVELTFVTGADKEHL